MAPQQHFPRSSVAFLATAFLLLVLHFPTQSEAAGVIFDHDGGVDDFIALLYLLNNKVDIRAVTVVPADCYREPAVRITKSMLDYFHGESDSDSETADIFIASSEDQGSNPFPAVWRQHSEHISRLPKLHGVLENPRHPVIEAEAPQLMVDLLSTGEKLTLIFCGPVTNLAAAMKLNPDIVANVERVYVMGGAIRVPGNVFDAKSHHDVSKSDNSAEWNIYNNPEAADEVFKSGVRITLVPLDATNKAPVTTAFLRRLKQQVERSQSVASQLAYDMWGVVEDYVEEGIYHFWDSLTAAVMLNSSFVTIEKLPISVVTAGPSEGRTVVGQCSETNTCGAEQGNHLADVVTGVDKAALEEHVLQGLL